MIKCLFYYLTSVARHSSLCTRYFVKSNFKEEGDIRMSGILNHPGSFLTEPVALAKKKEREIVNFLEFKSGIFFQLCYIVYS